MDTVSLDQLLTLRSYGHTKTSRDGRPVGKDFSHHLSKLAKSRQPSPLKELFQYMHPGMLSFAGGIHSDCMSHVDVI
jgi:hypothetical protein